MNLLINKFPHRESGWSSEEKNLRGGIHRKKTSEGGSLGKNPSRDRPIFAPCVLSRPARMHLNSHQWDHLHIASHHHFQLFYFQIMSHQVFCVTLRWLTLTRFPSLFTSGDTWKQIYICLLKHRHRPPVTFWHQMVAKKGRRADRRLGRPNQLIVWNVDQSRHLLLLDRPPNHRYFWGWSISMWNELLCFPILRWNYCSTADGTFRYV